MVKLSERAKDRFKGMADQIESVLKDIANNAGLVAKILARFVRGVLDGQHRP
jgi:hypothetical protein